ncbi:hypothetical protein EYF80_050309 [Liparis tanakae]|uniref:Uncharacterized protein n=1 Tax=Liparis tanakae TaxID=230148 RepID=A0A4Z2FFJ6_9TELE|nr:hypothetical protein EYF80_050309 [Liparis tanakae]
MERSAGWSGPRVFETALWRTDRKVFSARERRPLLFWSGGSQRMETLGPDSSDGSIRLHPSRSAGAAHSATSARNCFLATTTRLFLSVLEERQEAEHVGRDAGSDLE